jgi:hypothetical protein
VDLYTADVDHLVEQIEKDLDELVLLKTYVDTEALLFPSLERYSTALGVITTIVRKIVIQVYIYEYMYTCE